MDEMSFDVVDDLNWLAVAVATAVYYLLAGPWFADPFLVQRGGSRSAGTSERASGSALAMTSDRS